MGKHHRIKRIYLALILIAALLLPCLALQRPASAVDEETVRDDPAIVLEETAVQEETVTEAAVAESVSTEASVLESETATEMTGEGETLPVATEEVSTESAASMELPSEVDETSLEETTAAEDPEEGKAGATEAASVEDSAKDPAEDPAEESSMETAEASTEDSTKADPVETSPDSAPESPYRVVTGSGESLYVSTSDAESWRAAAEALCGGRVTFLTGLSIETGEDLLPEGTAELSFPLAPEGTKRVILAGISGNALTILSEGDEGAISFSVPASALTSALLFGVGEKDDSSAESSASSAFVLKGDFDFGSVRVTCKEKTGEEPVLSALELPGDSFDLAGTGRFFSLSATGVSGISEVSLLLSSPLPSEDVMALDLSVDPPAELEGAGAFGITCAMDHLGIIGLLCRENKEQSPAVLPVSYGVYREETFETIRQLDAELPFAVSGEVPEGYEILSCEIVRQDLLIPLDADIVTSDLVQTGDSLRISLKESAAPLSVLYGTLDESGAFSAFDVSFDGTQGNAVRDIEGYRYVKTLDDSGAEVLPVVSPDLTGTIRLIYRPLSMSSGGSGERGLSWPSEDLGAATYAENGGTFRHVSDDTVVLQVTGSDAMQEMTDRLLVIFLMDLSVDEGALSAEKAGIRSVLDSLPSDTLCEVVGFGSLATRITKSPVDIGTCRAVVEAQSGIAGESNWEDALLAAGEIPAMQDRRCVLVLCACRKPGVRSSRSGSFADDGCFTLSCPVFGNGSSDESSVSACLQAASSAAEQVKSSGRDLMVLDLGAGEAASSLSSGDLPDLASRKASLGYAAVTFTDPVASGKLFDRSTGFTYEKVRNGITYPGSVQDGRVSFADGGDTVSAAVLDDTQNAVIWDLGATYQVPDGVSYRLTYRVVQRPAARRLLAAASSTSSVSTLSYTPSAKDTSGVQLYGSARVLKAGSGSDTGSSTTGDLYGRKIWTMQPGDSVPTDAVTAHVEGRLIRDGKTSPDRNTVSLPLNTTVSCNLSSGSRVGTVTVTSLQKGSDHAYAASASSLCTEYYLVEETVPSPWRLDDFVASSTYVMPVEIRYQGKVLTTGYLHRVSSVGSDYDIVDYYRLGTNYYRFDEEGLITLTNTQKALTSAVIEKKLDSSGPPSVTGQTFPFRIEIQKAAGTAELTVQKGTVSDVTLKGAGQEPADGVYAIPLAGTTIVTLRMTAGTAIRLERLPVDCKIQVEEETTDGYQLVSARLKSGTKSGKYGQNYVKLSSKAGYTFTFTNIRTKTDLSLYKVSDSLPKGANTAAALRGYLLDGAVFRLKRVNSDGSTEVVLENIPVSANLNSPTVLKELDVSATYCLEETKAPEGHVILQKETYFTLGKDGKVTFPDDSLPYAKSLGYGLCIVNPAGEELPAAGGSGHLPFRAAGGGITALAAVLFVRGRRRKRGKKRNGEKNGVKMLKNCKHA
jgi:hypothetical protein